MPQAPTEPAIWPVILSLGILLLLLTVYLISRARGQTTWAKQAKRELDTIELGKNTIALNPVSYTHLTLPTILLV